MATKGGLGASAYAASKAGVVGTYRFRQVFGYRDFS